MNQYGQNITWGTLAAPKLFTGQTRDFSVRDALTKQLISDMVGDNMAMALHSRKAEINYEALVTKGSTDFVDLSAGAAIAVQGFATGLVLASRAIETWRLLQPKTASIQATWFPYMAMANPKRRAS